MSSEQIALLVVIYCACDYPLFLMQNNRSIWIVGCGDIGRRVADLYSNEKVFGLVSSTDSKTRCEQKRISTVIFDLDATYSHNDLPLNAPTHKDYVLYYFAPPTPKGEKDSRLSKFLSSLTQLPRSIVLISTTGVYGDSKGEWIDENTPTNPQADRAKRRLSAEQTLKHWSKDNNVDTMILRVAGIYAKNRLPLDRLKKGLPIVNEIEAGFTNRIHADDLAQVCKAAMECEAKNEIINVTDGNPSSMTAYFNHVADYANLPRPPQISMEKAEKVLSEGMVSYLKESRRIKNDKMLRLLGVILQHPHLDLSKQKT